MQAVYRYRAVLFFLGYQDGESLFQPGISGRIPGPLIKCLAMLLEPDSEIEDRFE